MKWSDLVAIRIREIREAKNMTQQDLADAVERVGGDLSRVTLGDIERGKRRVHLDDVAVIAAAMTVPLQALLGAFEIDLPGPTRDDSSWRAEIEVGELTFRPRDWDGWLNGLSPPDPLTGSDFVMRMMSSEVVERTRELMHEYVRFARHQDRQDSYLSAMDPALKAARELLTEMRRLASHHAPMMRPDMSLGPEHLEYVRRRGQPDPDRYDPDAFADKIQSLVGRIKALAFTAEHSQRDHPDEGDDQ